MGNQYQRQDVSNNIANGNIINADDLDAEFNALESAFTAGTGHSHDGTAGEGGPITVVGPAQDVIVSATQVLPKANNTLDLGSTSFKFKDAYVDGIVYADGITFNGTAITATAAELNKLAGSTVTATELNRLTGVTSNVQTQLDARQPLDAELTAIAGLVSAADRLPYFTGSGTATLATFTAAGRALVDDADATAQRTTLGLGTIATQNAASVTITGGTITGITDLAVADGGTGVSTITGIIRGNGTSPFSAAVAGTDFLAPAAIGTTVQAFNADLSAVAGLSTNGVIVRTGAGTAATRTVTAGAGISVTNGDGVSGNPTVAVSGLTTSEIAAATLVTAAEGISSNDNDTTIPTSAAVKQYADSVSPLKAWVNFNGVPASGTYSRTGTLVTVTLTGHGMTTGMVADLNFTTGTATDGSYTVTVTDANTFTVTDTASGSTSGNVTRNNYIRASLNVSSITDNSNGNYTVNFTSAISDAFYGATVLASSDVDRPIPAIVSQTASALQILIESGANVASDADVIHITVVR